MKREKTFTETQVTWVIIGSVFLCLLCFIAIYLFVQFQFQRFEQHMEVTIPATEQISGEKLEAELSVQVRKGGIIVIEGKTISLEQLKARLKSLAPNDSVVIHGSKDTDFQEIIDVLDIIKQAGVWNVAFASMK